MSRIGRLKRITIGRIEVFLETLEKPETILPQLVREMADKVQEAANAEAKSLGAVKGAQRKLDQITGQVLRYKEGAVLAVKVGDDDLAKQALSAQIKAEEKLDAAKKTLMTVQKAYDSANQVRKQLQANLTQLKTHKKELLARVYEVKQRQKIETVTFKSDTKAILDTVGRMEEKVEYAEAQAEVNSDVNKHNSSSSDKIDALLKDIEVDKQLENLKAKLNSDTKD